MQKKSIYLDSIIFMKVGFHVDETLEEIIARKKKEEQLCGKIFWGYGGTLCHPLTQVKPFIEIAQLIKKHTPILAMTFTQSRFRAEKMQASEYSVDGKLWVPLPSGVLVTGSKYAIVCRNLRRFEQNLDLCQYVVAVGPSKGKVLVDYLQYRVDKACAFLTDKLTTHRKDIVTVYYIAELVEPYAVFIK